MRTKEIRRGGGLTVGIPVSPSSKSHVSPSTRDQANRAVAKEEISRTATVLTAANTAEEEATIIGATTPEADSSVAIGIISQATAARHKQQKEEICSL
jgi:ribosomal protein S20